MTALTSNANDPTYSGHTRVYQTYEEANNATTTTNVPPGQAGEWDYALKDNDGAVTKAYCLRLVKADGNPFSTYTVIPQIATYVKPTISYPYNEVFDYGGSASTTGTITVTDVGGQIISTGNDLRIAIATSSINMLWDTTVTTPTFGGTASGSVDPTVSYEGGGSVMKIDVTTGFAAGDTLTIAGAKFTSFNTAISSTAGYLGIFTDGIADQTYNATTTATAAIRGTLVLADHGSGQVGDQWDTQTPTTTTHFRYNLTASGEPIQVATTTFNLSSMSGVAAADLTNAELYVDYNANGIVDGADAVATTTTGANLPPGDVSPILGSGTIKFATSTYYVVTGGKSYLLSLTASSLAAGDTMTVALTAANVTGATGTVSFQPITTSGSATNVTHTFDTAGGNTSPSLSVDFNAGNSITLNEGTYKYATASLSITDNDGCSTINFNSAVAYLASTTATTTKFCADNDGSCYNTGSTTAQASACIASTTGAASCTGGPDTTVTYDCGFKFWYIAAATDATAPNWASSIWSVAATTSDGSATTTASNTGQTTEINTLAAVSVTNSIDYGTVNPGSDTGATNSTTTATTTGNIWVDVNLSGTNMTGPGTLDVGQQCYLASSFTWATSCAGSVALTTSAVRLVLAGGLPTSTTSPPSSDTSWGIGIPGGSYPGSYTGVNTIDAIAH